MIPEVHRHAVPQSDVIAALRLIWQDMMRRGMLPDEVDNYRQSHNWFPWLRGRVEIGRLFEHVHQAIDPLGEPLGCQIMVQPPDGWTGKLVPHVDKRPGSSKPYRTIAGVALTDQQERNGGLLWWDELGHRNAVPWLEPGDVLEMPGRLPHASGGNHTGMPRIAVYLRWG